MSRKVGRSGTLPLEIFFREYEGGPLYDADPVTVDVLDPDDIEVVSNASPTSHPSLGKYIYSFTPAADAVLGVWRIKWSGVIHDVPVEGPGTDGEQFQVVEVGSVSSNDVSFASLADFEERKGDVPAGEEENVEALLRDATALISSEISTSTEAWLLSPSTVSAPSVIKAVCVAVAYRAWSNPDALSQATIADTSLTYARNSEVPDALFLTREERRAIRSAANLTTAQSVTLVSPYSGDDETDWPELPLD